MFDVIRLQSDKRKKRRPAGCAFLRWPPQLTLGLHNPNIRSALHSDRLSLQYCFFGSDHSRVLRSAEKTDSDQLGSVAMVFKIYFIKYWAKVRSAYDSTQFQSALRQVVRLLASVRCEKCDIDHIIDFLFEADTILNGDLNKLDSV